VGVGGGQADLSLVCAAKRLDIFTVYK
jgi:hypothetical protein